MTFLRFVGFASLCGFAVALIGEAGETKPANDLKVMSFNIRYGTANDGENHWDKRKTFLVETIEKFDPDLLGTQETLGFQRDFISKKLTGYDVFAAGRTDGKEDGEMMAVYWKKDRFEKLDGGHFWLSETPDKAGSKSWDSTFPRLATWVRLKDLKTNAKPLFWINTHFDHLGKTARLESAKLIREKLGKFGKDGPLLVTGDFNAGEGSDPYQALFGARDKDESPVLDSYRVVHPKRMPDEGTTTPFKGGANTRNRIDWIGVSPDWKIVAAGIDHTERDGRTPSDHFPVTAILRR